MARNVLGTATVNFGFMFKRVAFQLKSMAMILFVCRATYTLQKYCSKFTVLNISTCAHTTPAFYLNKTLQKCRFFQFRENC